MLKSILALLLSLSLLLTLAACSKEPEVPETDSTAEIVSQTQGEETDLISSEEDPLEESLVESIAESKVEVLDTASAVVESKVPSAAESKEETVSHPTSVPSVTSQGNEEQDVAPVDLFQGNTVEELLSWVRTNRQKADKVLADKPILSAAKKQSTMLVVSSKRKDLPLYKVLVQEKGEAIGYHFREETTKPLAEQEKYAVSIFSLSSNTQKNDLKSLFYPNKEVFLSTYKGMQYAYMDGFEDAETKERSFASAWFVKDGYVVKITVYWVNSLKPWNDAYFEYFDIQSVTL